MHRVFYWSLELESVETTKSRALARLGRRALQLFICPYGKAVLGQLARRTDNGQGLGERWTDCSQDTAA